MTPLAILPAALAAATPLPEGALDAIPLRDRIVLPDVQAGAPPADAGDVPTVQLDPPAASPEDVAGADMIAPQAVPVADLPDIGTIQVDKDPLEGFNRAMFGAFRVIDRFVYRPAAIAYKTVLPKPVRSGIRNVLVNLSEPIVFLNDLLQFKFKRAGKTLGRFVINTVVGVGGIFDVAKRHGLPHHGNGLGNTFAYYGIGPGPYIFLPILGPTTLRDLLGGAGDGLVLPQAVGTPFDRTDYQIGTGAASGLDQRVEQDESLRALMRGAVDPYATLRSAYLQDRAAQVRALHGHGDADPLGDPLADPLSDPAAMPNP